MNMRNLIQLYVRIHVLYILVFEKILDHKFYTWRVARLYDKLDETLMNYAE